MHGTGGAVGTLGTVGTVVGLLVLMPILVFRFIYINNCRNVKMNV